ncbi:MAG: FAD-binding protein [Syntrophorhabdaceae bacterium]|nr:FAD-binding protein [Syntrophorhabdaceae bacterium]
MGKGIEQFGEVLKTDVLIVGGGLAGNNAAIAACEVGAKVLIADKSSIERCGAIAGGVDHFMAYLNTDTWDTREAYLEWAGRIARGAVNLKIQNAVFCRELEAAIERMDRIGCSLRQPSGEFYRTTSFGLPGPYMINFNGKNLKPLLAKEARRLGAMTLEKCSITNLLTNGNGKVIGAVGFNIRKGNFYIILAKTTILATGNTNRIFQNPTGLPFNTWQCPANTGAAQTMAFEVGAHLANMEIVRITVVPRGFSAAGLNALTGMGGKIVNAKGEEFMFKYHPMGNKAPRYKLVEGVMREIEEGRGPVYIDCRHLSEGDMKHLKTTLGYDKDTLPDFIEQKGIDLRKDLLEIMASEGMQAGPSEICSSGIMIDEETKSTVEGLFGAGDCTDQMRCSHVCTTGGYLAGKMAAKYALTFTQEEPSVNQVKELKRKVYAPMRASGKVSQKSFEDTMRRMLWVYAGASRNEYSLNTALEKLDGLEKYFNEIKAGNYHELMRTHETRQILSVAKMMCHASLARKETRFGVFHRRTDYPETNPEFDGQIVVVNTDQGIKTFFNKLDYSTIPEP